MDAVDKFISVYSEQLQVSEYIIKDKMVKSKEVRRRLSSVSLEVNTLPVGESYPWNLLWRTVLLWVSFFTSAGAESVRPPTLLDIRDRLNCSTEETTYQFTVQAAGGLAGCIISGVLADRYS